MTDSVAMRTHTPATRARRSAGYSFTELAVVVLVILIISGMAMPGMRNAIASFRVSGDAQEVAEQLQLAKLRAANKFTHVRLVIINPITGTFQLQYLQNCPAACAWVPEPNTQYLSKGIRFQSLGAIVAPGCPAGAIANMACSQPGGPAEPPAAAGIEFNSRGIPVDTTGGCAEPCGNPTGQGVIYLRSNTARIYAVSVNAAGGIKTWRYNSANGTWVAI